MKQTIPYWHELPDLDLYFGPSPAVCKSSSQFSGKS